MTIAHIRYTKSEVDYTDHAKMKSQRCAVCRHFDKPHGCELVDTFEEAKAVRIAAVKKYHGEFGRVFH